jgi:hypothetical protein
MSRGAFAVLAVLTAAVLVGILAYRGCKPSHDLELPTTTSPTGQEQPWDAQGTPRVDAPGASPETNRVSVGPAAAMQPRTQAKARDTALILRTVTAEGEGLVGCQILARSAIAPGGQRPFEIQLQETADGVHAVRDLPRGAYDIVSQIPNIKKPITRIQWTAEESIDTTIALASRFDLTGGVVRHVSGSGVPDVLISDRNRSSQAFFCVSDRDGRFLFCRAEGYSEPSGSFSLSSKRGAAIADSRDPIDLFWGVLDRVIVPEARQELVVRVMDKSGHVLEHFTVQTESVHDGDTICRTATSTNGFARLRAVPTGKVRILALPDVKWLPAWGTAEVAADGSGVATLVTDAAVELCGRVTSSGRLLKGGDVVVELAAIGDSPPIGEMAVDAIPYTSRVDGAALGVKAAVLDGTFCFGCDPRARYRLLVSAPGYADRQCIVSANHGVFSTVDVDLVPLRRIRLLVTPEEVGAWLSAYSDQQGVAAAGKPCCFALVEATPLPGAKRAQFTALPDQHGALEFSRVSAGQWHLQLRGPLQSALLATIDVHDGEDPPSPSIDLEHLRPGRLTGALHCDGSVGKPVLVAASNGRGQVQVPVMADGSFDMALPEGDYVVRTRVERGPTSASITFATPIHVSAGSATRLERDVSVHRLSLRLVDSDSGSPLSGATLSVDEDRSFGEFRTLKTNDRGEVLLEPCPVGEFGLSIMNPEKMTWKKLQRLTLTGSDPVILRVQR